MDHSHHEDDFEGYAPPRRMDLGARSPAERPEWLTAAGERDLRDLPPGRADSAREAVTGLPGQTARSVSNKATSVTLTQSLEMRALAKNFLRRVDFISVLLTVPKFRDL